MKKSLGSQHSDDDEDLQNAVTGWLRTQVAEFYEEGILKLVKRYDLYLNLNGDYVEK